MANFNSVANGVQALLNSVTASRSAQGIWYMREGARRTMVDFRETGTPKVYALTAGSASTYVQIESATACRLFGLVIENTHSSALAAGLYNHASGTPTVGTAVVWGILVPATTVMAVTFDTPYVFSSSLVWAATTAVEGSTQTNGTLIKLGAVYTT